MSIDRESGAGWSVHPGEILQQEFLKPMKISKYALAKAIGVTPQRIGDITLKKTGISADMAIRLALAFETTPEFWMNMQAAWELAQAEKDLKREVKKIHALKSAA
jgi:antitoxin HigA-1